MDQDKVQASHLHSLLHQQSRVLGTDHGDELNGGRQTLKLTRGGEQGVSSMGDDRHSNSEEGGGRRE